MIEVLAWSAGIYIATGIVSAAWMAHEAKKATEMTKHEKRAQVQRIRGRALALLAHYEEHLEAMACDVARIMDSDINDEAVDDYIGHFLASPGDRFDYAMMLLENRLERCKKEKEV